MQTYELMTPNEINDLPKVYTTVQFSTEQTTNCLDLFTKDFSFNKVIPIPENYQIVHGPVIEKALAMYLTSFGRSNPQMMPGYYTIIVEMLQYAGITIPEDFNNWFQECTANCDTETWQRFYQLGYQYYENYKRTKTFTTVGFCGRFWGTPSDVIEVISHTTENTIGVVLTTLAKPPLAWLVVLSEMYPALNFIITVEDSNIIVTYKLHWGSLEKIHEEPASVITDNEPKLNTMGIF